MRLMSRSIFVAAALGLAACQSSHEPSAEAASTITVSVGPCFGFCPVYALSVDPQGAVSFDGQRHTAVLGEQHRQVQREVYQALAHDLEPFRPTPGTEANVPCDAAISDTSTYTITWVDPKGGKTVARHHSGCNGGPGQALDQVLRGLPERLGVQAWTQQTTRPGVSRG